jgi:hypothetical protein
MLYLINDKILLLYIYISNTLLYYYRNMVFVHNLTSALHRAVQQRPQVITLSVEQFS